MNEDPKRLGLPDRRKHTYAALEKRLDTHIDEIALHLRKWLRRGLFAFAIIGLACAAALFGFGYVVHDLRTTRANFTRDNCTATNSRHDNTYNALVAAAQTDQDNAPNEAAREEIRRRRDVTLALIDALAPHQNCTYLVKLSVGDATPTPTPTPPKAQTP